MKMMIMIAAWVFSATLVLPTVSQAESLSSPISAERA